MRKFFIGYIVLTVLFISIVFGNDLVNVIYDKGMYTNEDGITYQFAIDDERLIVYNGENWNKIFINGVNMGLGKPGSFPGEYAISEEEYLRWFKQIQEMNVNNVRVYTLQSPAFYNALAKYNETSERPLYVIQGVYVDEEAMFSAMDAFKDDNYYLNEFINYSIEVIDAIHGNLTLEKQYGRPHGEYTKDVSKYILAMILGVEWDPYMVNNTNKLHEDMEEYHGEYVYTSDSNAFEKYLAMVLDQVIAYESKGYSMQRPMAICNWVTLDPINHPNEPDEKEDLTSINVDNIKTTANFYPGMFASYHIYPYYPEGIVYDEEYSNSYDRYLAYLQELNAFHKLPILVSEVGLPTSRGITHDNPDGYTQGHLSYEEQGYYLTELIDDIYNEGMMGGLIFSWQDEWFKRTWNTMDYDVDDRRPYWYDAQTSEQNFGLLAFVPDDPDIVIDGEVKDWKDEELLMANEQYQLYCANNDGYLYFRVDGDFSKGAKLNIALDTINDQGNDYYQDQKLAVAADFIISIDNKDNSEVLVDQYYDVNQFMYGYTKDIIDPIEDINIPDSNTFNSINLILSNEIYLPDSQISVPVKLFNTGKLLYGNSDENNLVDYCYSDKHLEIRIPYLLLNIADPSNKLQLKNLYSDNIFDDNGIASQYFDHINIAIDDMVTSYTWDNWEETSYYEKLKDSYYILQDYYSKFDDLKVEQDRFVVFWHKWNQKAFSKIATWFPIQPILNYMIAFCLSMLIYFFIVLIYVHFKANVNNYLDNKLKYQMLHDKQNMLKKLKTKRALNLMMHILMEDNEEFLSLRNEINDKSFKDYLAKKLHSKDDSVLIMVIIIIAKLNIQEFSENIKNILIKNKNIDLQYYGFMALSVLGAYKQLCDLCMHNDYEQQLSYRSLLEIFSSYTNDKYQLFNTLLDSKDNYIKRVCIKQIGNEKIISLASKVAVYLGVEDNNMLIDTVRCLGQLQYNKANDDILALLNNTSWELRAICVVALAQIDLPKNEEAIINMLHDRQWNVRYNAAKVLVNVNDIDDVVKKIEASNDKYALEILNSMIEDNNRKKDMKC